MNDPKDCSRVRIGTSTAVPIPNAEIESAVNVMWVGNPLSSEGRKPGENNEEENNNFEDTENVEPSRIPQLGNVACSRTANVMQAISIPCACNPPCGVGSLA